MDWPTAITRLGGDHRIAAVAWDDLQTRYAEPHRRYHDLRHVTAVARDSGALAVAFGLGARERALVAIAAWTHDVVYDARPGEDEQASAAWTRDELTNAGVPAADVERAGELVLSTIHHAAPDEDLLATALLDADLAILGATPEDYEQYANGVREEYSIYSDEDWRAGRAAVLENLLARPRLYRSDIARARWEGKARENLSNELTRWRGADPHHR
ncbi:HD domain-containing protein [Amycolatopsis sp. w19]|uniref:HD domain-containing protein n=1 Tax=Amycolatopsis sp. w19 TaxID=3448134 RepID=UPI003F1DD3F0